MSRSENQSVSDTASASPFIGLDHLVFLTRDIESSLSYWQKSLKVHTKLDHSEQGLAQAFLTLADGTFIELVAPTSEDSAVARLIDERGDGFYVLAMQVEDMETAQQYLKNNGATLLGEGTERVFVKPEASSEPMIQLWPKDRPHRWRDQEQ